MRKVITAILVDPNRVEELRTRRLSFSEIFNLCDYDPGPASKSHTAPSHRVRGEQFRLLRWPWSYDSCNVPPRFCEAS